MRTSLLNLFALATAISGAIASPLSPKLSRRDSIDNIDGKKVELEDKDVKGRESRYRTLDVKLADKQIIINSNTKSTNQSDRFSYTFGVRNMPHIRASYFNKTNDDDSKVRSTWMLGILGVAEVTPSMNITQTDSFIHFLGEGNKWSSMKVVDNLVGNATFKTATITYTEGAFTCTINATFSPANATDGTVTFKPNAVKYSMELNNFPYKYNGSDLVIAKMFFASQTTKLEGKGANRTISFSDKGGFFNWVSSATTENGTVVELEPMNSTLFASDLPIASQKLRDADLKESVKNLLEEVKAPNKAAEKTALALFKTKFPTDARPTKLVWDPEVGVYSNAQINPSSSAGYQLPVNAVVSLIISALLALML
ncbi:hypothetical protein HK102_007577 [Quaeritorhiza haematococci]|nr:hypothetical protein HK102_007577 [Quaeritorhiza haematococci]